MLRFYQWCVRAWPFWATLVVIGTHLVALAAFSQQSENINKVFSISLQVVGGMLVLHSIDSTLGMLRGESIPRLIAQWFRSCPMWRKPKTIKDLGIAAARATTSGHGRVKRQATSLSSRVSELERQMDEVYRDMGLREQALKKLVSEVKDELSARASKSEAAICEVEGKIDATALGSIKQQVFGVVIAVYGAGLAYFS